MLLCSPPSFTVSWVTIVPTYDSSCASISDASTLYSNYISNAESLNIYTLQIMIQLRRVRWRIIVLKSYIANFWLATMIKRYQRNYSRTFWRSLWVPVPSTITSVLPNLSTETLHHTIHQSVSSKICHSMEKEQIIALFQYGTSTAAAVVRSVYPFIDLVNWSCNGRGCQLLKHHLRPPNRALIVKTYLKIRIVKLRVIGLAIFPTIYIIVFAWRYFSC